MAWEARTLGEICRQIKDTDRNGGMSMDKLITHMKEDTLVAWGWRPGKGRVPAQGTQNVFGDLIAYWAKTGAHCP